MNTLNIEIKTTAGAQWLVMLAKSKLKQANKGYGSRSRAMTELNKARARLRQIITGTHPVAPQEIDFMTVVSGIPCGIVVTSLTEGRCNTWGHPDNQEPDEPGEIEFVVVDHKGYEADWLRAKVDPVKLENHVWALVHGRPVGEGVY